MILAMEELLDFQSVKVLNTLITFKCGEQKILNEFLIGSCNCNDEGSTGCNEVAQCICKDNVEGAMCDHCMDNFYGFPECQGNSSGSAQ